MKHKVSALQGALLDAAVAKAQGFDFELMANGCNVPGHRPEGDIYAPSTDWEDAGPIIIREQITLTPMGSFWIASIQHKHYGEHGDAMIAAMRAYCASKFGEEVDLP